MRIGVPAETAPRERRVALTPDVAKWLAGEGFELVVQAGAGAPAGFPDAAYIAAGAGIEDDPEVVMGCDVVAAVRRPDQDRMAGLRRGTVLIGLLQPLDQPEAMIPLAATGASCLAFETLPRTTRAQSMDVLSSQATVAGYEAVIAGASALGKLFPMLTTAAGTLAPARVLVLGAGVAGLQAIATARRLGARVSAYDVRAAAREQVQSLGAHFVEVGIAQQEEAAAGGYARELDRDSQTRLQAELRTHVAASDVVVCTAQIPGKPAPVILTHDMVERMHPGSVIVDAAAPTGGNCELTVRDETVIHGGVAILGPTDLESRAAAHAAQMYARNVQALLGHLAREGRVLLDFDDEITAGCAITHEGRIVSAAVNRLLNGGGG